MQIIVKTFGGQTITLHVKKTDTIDIVKAKIFKQGIRIKQQQRLIFEGSQLEDDSTVERCIPLPVLEIGGMGSMGSGGDEHKGNDDQQEEEKGGGDKDEEKDEDEESDSDGEPDMEIFVQIPHLEKTISLNVEASYTIDTVKALIKSKEGIPRYTQRLIFNDGDLDGGYTLSKYNIQKDATLTLLIKGDGGGKRVPPTIIMSCVDVNQHNKTVFCVCSNTVNVVRHTRRCQPRPSPIRARMKSLPKRLRHFVLQLFVCRAARTPLCRIA